jgi:hypothetical protein
MPGTGERCSSVGDMARFTAAVHSGSLLEPGSVQAMVTPHAFLPDREALLRQLIPVALQ